MGPMTDMEPVACESGPAGGAVTEAPSAPPEATGGMTAGAGALARPRPHGRWWLAPLCAVLLAAGGLAVFANGLANPFLAEDLAALVDSPRLHHLGQPWRVLLGVPGSPAAGQPLTNLSLAVNYALGGEAPLGYRAVSLALHLLGALTLFALIRRTLLRPRSLGPRSRAHCDPCGESGKRSGLWRAMDFCGAPAGSPGSGAGMAGPDRATLLAFVASLLWVVHPLHTDAITHVVHRGMVLAGLLSLLTLYFAVRALDSRSGRWTVAAVVAGGAAMLSHPLAVILPLLVVVYDRVFAFDTPQADVRRWKRLYGGLAGTWVLAAAALVAVLGQEDLSLDPRSPTPGAYLLSQVRSLPHYLRLAVRAGHPAGAYGGAVPDSLLSVLPHLAVLAVLGVLTVVALRRGPRLGFAAAAFWLLLLPTSSLFPHERLLAEHRMYLPLAALCVVVTMCAYALVAAVLQRLPDRSARLYVVWAPLSVGLLCVLLLWGGQTVHRNRQSADPIALWREGIRLGHDTAGVRVRFGMALERAGRIDEALGQYEAALQTEEDARAYHRAGVLLARRGQFGAAIQALRAALDRRPHSPDAHLAMGVALSGQGEHGEALKHFERAVALDPDRSEAHGNLAAALLQRGATTRAVEHARRAVQLDPQDPQSHNALGVALLHAGSAPQAVQSLERALRLNPSLPQVRYNLAAALLQVERAEDAFTQLEEVVRLDPHHRSALQLLMDLQLSKGALLSAEKTARSLLERFGPDAGMHNNLGTILARLDRADAAMLQYGEALRIDPNFAPAYLNLGVALAERADYGAAVQCYETFLRLQPQTAEVYYQLALCHIRLGRYDAALQALRTAAELDPRNPDTLMMLGAVLAASAPADAASAYRRALDVVPTHAGAAMALAWLLATCPQEDVRNGPEAVRLVEQVLAATPVPDAHMLDTLAAAYAETGRFDLAIQTAQRAIALAYTHQAESLVRQFQQRLRLYEGKTPYRQER